jgi:hypothetical protein
MKFPKKYLALFSIMAFIMQFACKDNVTEPINTTLEFVGFEDKFALRMVLDEPNLYVCAGSDGVWRRDIRSMSEWQYLGLRDTSLGKYGNVGALDIDVSGDDILVAYNGSTPHVNFNNTIAVWRSTNGGMDWFRSDSGIPETIDSLLEQNIFTSLQRSPHQPNIVIGCIESTSYRSTNGGSYWTLLAGRRGVILNEGYVRWHPFRPGEVWFFGEASLFYPYCYSLQNYGADPKTGVNFDSLGFPSDGAVYDVAFDAGNADIVYAATSQGVIMTADGGYTWRNNAISLQDNGFVFRMAYHPSIRGVLYLAGGKRIYVTYNTWFNQGKIGKMIGEIERGFISSILLDTLGDQLFIGTIGEGVYTLKINGR